ncbi:MAG: MFS transporter [Marmoricola sp.]
MVRVLPAPGPVRQLALVTLVNTTGNGIFYTLSALYFTRILGFSVVSVGAGLSIAAFAGLLAGVPIGHLADRRGAREVLAVMLLATCVADGLLLAVQAYWQFVLIASVTVFVESGANAARNALIAGVVQGSQRAATKAYLRSITNVGMTLGTAIAAIALHFDSRTAYVSVLYVDVAGYLVCAILATRLPRVTPTSRSETPGMFAATRDLPFVVVTLITAVLNMHYWIIEIAMPLWVVDHTQAPRWLVSVLVVVNTGTVVVGQVLVARRVTTLHAAITASAVSGVLFVGACGLFGLSGSVGVAAAAALLVAAALLDVFGELSQAAASFLLGFELAPDHATGQYQGLYGMGFALSALLAPTVMAVLPLRMGLPGWWILGGILLAAALAIGPAVRWAERTRGRYGVVVLTDSEG